MASKSIGYTLDPGLTAAQSEKKNIESMLVASTIKFIHIIPILGFRVT